MSRSINGSYNEWNSALAHTQRVKNDITFNNYVIKRLRLLNSITKNGFCMKYSRSRANSFNILFIFCAGRAEQKFAIQANKGALDTLVSYNTNLCSKYNDLW